MKIKAVTRNRAERPVEMGIGGGIILYHTGSDGRSELIHAGKPPEDLANKWLYFDPETESILLQPGGRVLCKPEPEAFARAMELFAEPRVRGELPCAPLLLNLLGFAFLLAFLIILFSG